MRINRDTMGHLSEPDLILIKASEERVGVLQATNKNWVTKYNELDTLSFEIPFMIDREKTSFYDQIDIMKYIEVPDINAVFSIKDVEIENEGQTTEFKKVECQSRECELAQKYLEEFTVNCGTTGSIDGVKFYQPGNQTHSLLHLVITEKCPGWSFKHISASLWTMQRSFEVTRQDIYSFLMGDVMEAFECIFVFDSKNRTISAYTESEYGKDTNVHVSYNNLLQNTDMSYSIDDVKTCVTLKGDSDLEVREINMGYDRIYDFSVYASEEYMSQSLLNAYHSWMALVDTVVDPDLFTYKDGVITRAELQGKSYKQAYTLLLTKYQNYYTDISKWTNTLLPYGINTRYPGYGTISYTEDGSDAVTFSRYTSAELVDSLPSSGSENTLYLIKNTNNMYRYNGAWVDVNKWINCCLTALKEKQASAENLQAVAMKAGYGDAESTDTTIAARYVDTYLPALYMYNAVTKQIESVNQTLSALNTDQGIIQTDKMVITNKTAMRNNFTADQLKELSTFIREDEVTSSNFVVTDTMTEAERFDMLYALLDYGQKELAKVSAPQIQFSASLSNIYAIPEFDDYSDDFDIGNYIWVTLRDDYSIKAKILQISIDFMDRSRFSVTFGNIMKKAKNIFTDITDALNAATSAATSVSFSASHWSASAEQTDSIGQALQKGLLSQSYYLANAEDNETLIDENGVWITTTTGEHGRDNTDDYDSIYLGGGRILFTEDGWRTVSMSTGRADVDMPSINDQGQLVFTTESKFGVFADFLMAGYVGGSLIVGGDIYSSNYQTSNNKNVGNSGTHINLTDGTFEFNSKTTGKKRLFMKDNTLEVNGIIQAQEGHIGCDDNGEGGFIIQSLKMYNGKSTLSANSDGVYIGTNGIGLGQTTTYTTPSSGNVTKSMFEVDNYGNLYAGSVNVKGRIYASSGYIGDGTNGFTINSTSIINGKTNLNDTNDGIYLGTDGIALGRKNNDIIPFSVTKYGVLTATSGTIGGWTIGPNQLKSGDIYISSSGSIRHEHDDGEHVESNWGISSSGHAYFKDVFITGVEENSYFGQLYLNDDGWTFYDSNALNPFEGNCKLHIEELAVGKITADKAEIGWLDANDITTNLLVANKIDVKDFYYDGAKINWQEITYVTGVTLSVDESNDAWVSTEPGGTATVLDINGDTQSVPTDVGHTKISYYKKLKLECSKKKSTVLGQENAASSSSEVSIISITE